MGLRLSSSRDMAMETGRLLAALAPSPGRGGVTIKGEAAADGGEELLIGEVNPKVLALGVGGTIPIAVGGLSTDVRRGGAPVRAILDGVGLDERKFGLGLRLVGRAEAGAIMLISSKLLGPPVLEPPSRASTAAVKTLGTADSMFNWPCATARAVWCGSGCNGLGRLFGGGSMSRSNMAEVLEWTLVGEEGIDVGERAPPAEGKSKGDRVYLAGVAVVDPAEYLCVGKG